MNDEYYVFFARQEVDRRETARAVAVKKTTQMHHFINTGLYFLSNIYTIYTYETYMQYDMYSMSIIHGHITNNIIQMIMDSDVI